VFFRNKKRYNDAEGYDRISRMIEDRQSESEEEEDDLFEEETVLLSRDARQNRRRDEPANRESGRLAALDEPDEDGSEENVTLVRPPERLSARASTPEPVAASPYAPPSLETQRMALPDLRGTDTAAGGGPSLVAKDAIWEGKLVCSGNVRIEGTLRGEIETAGTLFVAAEARVEGSVRARMVTLAGEVQGDLQCSERLEILPGGAARGEVDTGALVVHDGAFIESRFQMRRDAVGA
jgi:cytoskeletal protein CcmA (bactofilin family)